MSEQRLTSQGASSWGRAREEAPLSRHQWMYALQWVAYTLGVILVTTALVGPGLGLSQRETVEFGSRVLVVTGLVTLLQVYFGHRYPIVEGPGVIYWAMYLFTVRQASSRGAALSDIEGGMIAAGTAVVLFAAGGLARRGSRIFTPTLAGTALILISLSFLADSATQLAGVAPGFPAGNPSYFVAVVVVILTGAFMSLIGPGRLRTVPVLGSVAASYVLFALLGQVEFGIVGEVPAVGVPRLLAWGPPTLRADVATTFVVAALLATVNTFASVEAAAAVYGHASGEPRYRAGILWNGVAQLVAGIGAAMGTASLASSAVIVGFSRAGARSALALAGLFMIVLGFFPPFSALLSTVPLPIVNGVFFLLLAQLLTLGFDQLLRVQFDARQRLVVGIALMAGLAVTYVPPTLFSAVPLGGSFLLGNPIIVGTTIAVLNEQILFGKWVERLR